MQSFVSFIFHYSVIDKAFQTTFLYCAIDKAFQNHYDRKSLFSYSYYEN